MIYTIEAKQEMDRIIGVFADYIQKQSYFDILYSEKVGYIRVLAERPEAEAPMVMDTPDLLLETLIGDVADDVIYEKLPVPLPEDEDVPEEIKAEIYRQIMELVDRIEEAQTHYVHLAINYYQNRFEKRADN